MKRWINCAQCGQPLAAALTQTDGRPFCSGGCLAAFELEVKRLKREERDRRDAALERQADRAGAQRMGGILLGLIVVALLHGCDSPKDLLGPDEKAHMAEGRLALR